MSDIYDWRYENSISYSKDKIDIEDITEQKYVPWRTNKYFSNFVDSCMQANEMNLYSILDNKLQYDYYLLSIRKQKRFFKKDKTNKNDDFEAVKYMYKYNDLKTKQVLKILNKEKLNDIKLLYKHIQENKVK